MEPVGDQLNEIPVEFVAQRLRGIVQDSVLLVLLVICLILGGCVVQWPTLTRVAFASATELAVNRSVLSMEIV